MSKILIFIKFILHLFRAIIYDVISREFLLIKNRSYFYIKHLYSLYYYTVGILVISKIDKIVKICIPLKNNCYEIRNCLNFCSYDYLGFASTYTDHIEDSNNITYYKNKAEKTLANFFDKKYCIIYSSGFGTNALLIPQIVNDGDIIFSDRKNHASIIEGTKMSKIKKNIQIKLFNNQNLSQLENLLKELHHDYGDIYIISESVNSCTGLIIDLPELIRLKHSYKFKIILDEAHGKGVLGTFGKGLYEYYNVPAYEVDIDIGSLSKSFNAFGGFLLTDSYDLYTNLKENIDLRYPIECYNHIINIVNEISKNNFRIKKVKELSIYLKKRLREIGIKTLGNADIALVSFKMNFVKAVNLWHNLIKKNIIITIIGYPAADYFSIVIRLCLTSKMTLNDIDYLVNSINMCDNIKTFKIEDQKISLDEKNIIQNFGIGTCGPRKFLGNILHINMLEQKIFKIFNTTGCIVFPHNYCGLRSCIEAIASLYTTIINKTNKIIVEEGLALANKNFNYYIKKNLIISQNDVSYNCEDSDNLLIMTNDIYIPKNKFTYIIGDFETINGWGSFLCTNKNFIKNFELLLKSHIFSAVLPAYLLIRNINLLNDHLNK